MTTKEKTTYKGYEVITMTPAGKEALTPGGPGGRDLVLIEYLVAGKKKSAQVPKELLKK